MDVCTLIVVTTMTLQMCYSKNICKPDGIRELCTGLIPIPCNNISFPTYECKRSDGSTYTHEDKNVPSMTIAPN